jgi:UDP-N-acetylglucosamine 1-carboxyvinyltransferase
LDEASVTATENAVMAAALASGTTTISNAASEPHVQDLCGLLNAMGAKITGQGSAVMQIEGVSEFNPVDSYSTVGDRIEAGTLLVAGALGGGPLTVQGISPDCLGIPLMKLRTMGCKIDTTVDSITIFHDGSFKSTDIQTLPYPGFPTDLQSPFVAMLTLARGTSFIKETVFENRFRYTNQLVRMGAQIKTDGSLAIVTGVKKLSSATVYAEDLRGGAALILAALAANGQSVVENAHHINRGYENLAGDLMALGACVKYVE